MRRLFIVLTSILFAQLLAVSLRAQTDKLVGRWEGKVQSPQGERDTWATFKKEGDVYSGAIPSMRGAEMALKDIKLEGNKVTAKAEIETPQGTVTINYSFTLEGDTMKGQGSADFGGQSFTFDLNLKRAASQAAAQAQTAQPTQPTQPAQQPQQGQARQRMDVPQPQQKQSLDYFAGQWSYKYVGRESALGPAPRECTVTFTKRADGKSLESVTNCKHEGGAYKDSAVIVFDEAAKMLTFTEKLGSGATLNSRADWSSPIALRFTIDPVKIKGQSLQLRRTIAVVAAHSFTITEELSEDGGPFIRLGSAVVSKVSVN